MDLSSLLYSLGLSGFFASRAFLPAFVTSLAMKYGDKIPFLGDLDFVQAAANSPNWFTNNYVVSTLGILSLVELLAEKSPEVRELMEQGMVYVKSILAAATSYGLLSSTDAAAVGDIISQAGFLDVVPSAAAGFITYFFGSTRNEVVSIVSESDEDDSLGIQGFLSWCEEVWAFFGVWILLFVPFLVTILIAVVYGFFFLIQKRHEKKEEAARIPCPNCATKIHSFATACHACGRTQENPKKLGFLGGISEEAESNLDKQRLRLIELKRSPLSGERVSGRGVDLRCEVDDVALLGDANLNRRYIDQVDGRLAKVMILGAAFGLVPIIGLIVGVIYYRFQLVAPYRRYLPSGKGLAVKWLVRLIFFALVIFQLVPGVGALAVPLMAFINHRFYKSAFVDCLEKAGKL